MESDLAQKRIGPVAETAGESRTAGKRTVYRHAVETIAQTLYTCRAVLELVEIARQSIGFPESERQIQAAETGLDRRRVERRQAKCRVGVGQGFLLGIKACPQSGHDVLLPAFEIGIARGER